MSANGIYGLSGSGMDVESLVKLAMKAKQTQYDKMYKNEMKQEWTKSAYSDFYSSMTTFKYTTLSNYKMQSTMSAMKAASNDEKIASVTANGDAATMTHSITVKSMTTNAYLQTTSAGISRDNTAASAKNSMYLKDVLQSGLPGGGIASYDSTKDIVTFTDGTTMSSASTTAAISFRLKDASTSTTTTNYTTTTTDASGKNVASFIPGAVGSGTYTDPTTGTVYNTDTVDNGTSGFVTTLKDSGGNVVNTYTTKTTDDKTGNPVASFRPAAVTGTTTSTSGDTTTTTTTAGNSDGSIATSIATTKPEDGDVVSYSYADLAEKTLNDLAVDMAGANGNITASYDSVNDSFSIYNKNGGASNLISIAAITGSYTNTDGKTVQAAASTTLTNSLFNHLNLGIYDGTVLNAAQTMSDTNPLSAVGKSGSVTIDGKDYTNLTSNKITAGGVNYTLQAIGSTTVTVNQDTDAIIKNVKQFVSDYNKMIDSLNDKIYETQYSKYQPLTDTEKKAMSTDEVTAWEKKAKSGLLYHSTVLRNIVSGMRSALSTPVDAVDSDYNTLGSIGISASTSKGHIDIDEAKLKKALQADPDSVYQLFASSPKSDKDTANMGVANRLDLVMKDALSSISTEAGMTATTSDQSRLGKLITSLKDKMDDYQDMMDDYQTRLYKQYDAMETAIANLNSQASYVTSAFK
ncbi:MAG: flagellar filament capping protein FliD [Selenomonadaceae bacterium]